MTRRVLVLGSAVASLAACREPPAREMRRIEGVNVEIRAIGLPRPPEAALNAAFAQIARIDGDSLDRAVGALHSASARKGLVNLGGDHMAVFGEPLVVAVPDPVDATRPRWASFTLTDAALGRSVRRDLGRSATVIARTGAEASSWAQAVSGLDPPAAVARIAASGNSGFVLATEGTRRVVHATSGFAAAHDLRGEEGVEVRP